MKKIILMSVFLLCGCASVTPYPTSMTLIPQAMEIMGPAKGESRNTRLFCVIPMSGANASLITATENAVKYAGADAIVNPVVDDERGIGFLGLWCWQKIKVYGMAVRFKRNGTTPPAPVAARAQRVEKGQIKTGTEPRIDADTITDTETISDMESRIFKNN